MTVLIEAVLLTALLALIAVESYISIRKKMAKLYRPILRNLKNHHNELPIGVLHHYVFHNMGYSNHDIIAVIAFEYTIKKMCRKGTVTLVRHIRVAVVEADGHARDVDRRLHTFCHLNQEHRHVQ